MYVHVFRIIMSHDSSYNASHLLPVPTAHSHVSAAHSEVTLKRLEVVNDDFPMANIETQWAFLPVYIYVEKSAEDVKNVLGCSLAFPTSGSYFH